MANFFIAFVILTSAVSDLVSALKVPNLILSYIYVSQCDHVKAPGHDVGS